jgi:hypothetical protein
MAPDDTQAPSACGPQAQGPGFCISKMRFHIVKNAIVAAQQGISSTRISFLIVRISS